MARNRKSQRPSVFKGREAKLNRAVFQVLATKGPLTIYEVCREIKTLRGLKYTQYTNVNRRVRALEQPGYIAKAGMRKTRAGFEASTYELTARGYLALIFNQTDMDYFIENAEERQVLEVLAALAAFT